MSFLKDFSVLYWESVKFWNIKNNVRKLYAYGTFVIDISLILTNIKCTLMLDQMCVTAGTIYIQNVNKVCLEFWRPDCWHLKWEDWLEGARALPTGNLLTRDVNNKGQQKTKNRDFILNVKRPVGISHLVVHMRFFAWPKV